MRKAQGLSMNTIIVAALGLIVLIVLVLIFSGRAGWFSKSTSSCAAQGGYCSEDQSGRCGPGEIMIWSGDCSCKGPYEDADRNNQFCSEKPGGQCCKPLV